MTRSIAIEGGQVGLFAFQEHHINAESLGWFQDTDLTKFFSTTFRRFDEEAVRNLIGPIAKESNRHTYGVVRLVDDLFIGVVLVGPINPVHRLCDVVTLIGEDSARGQRLSGETVFLASQLAFQAHKARKLTTTIFAENHAARRAYASAGWFQEAELRDHLIVDGQPMGMIHMSCFPENVRDYRDLS